MCGQPPARQGKKAAVGNHVGTMWGAVPTLLRPSALRLVDMVLPGLHVSHYKLCFTDRRAYAAHKLVHML